MQQNKTEVAHQRMQNEETNLFLSSYAKPRLKWTPELHHRFKDAVTQLGGADKATPKSLMSVMGNPGLTLYHLKSHLQKYRLGKSQQSETSHNKKQGDCEANQKRDANISEEIGDGIQNQINESMQIAQTFQMQIEQRKLQEQIEVQRQLQQRIEAQGKYLQSLLKKAEETLTGYNSSCGVVELAKAELSQLFSVLDNGSPSSSLSILTDVEGSTSLEVMETNPAGGTGGAAGCSLESSLTSSESSGRKTTPANECNANSSLLSIMELHPRAEQKGSLRNQIGGRKRIGSTVSNGNCAEPPSHTNQNGCPCLRSEQSLSE